MPEYCRVLDRDTGHKLTVLCSEVPNGNYEALDEPATTERTGLPLEPEFNTKPLSSTTTSGQKAEPKKEKANG